MDKFKIPLTSFLISISVIALSILAAEVLYGSKKMIKRGYEIEISSDGKVVKKEEKPIDFDSLLKAANVDNGAKIFKKCASCHSADKNGGNKIGPNLFGIVGRKRASISGFNYSEAIIKKGGYWSRDDLNLFLTKPKDFIPNTKMGFAGLKKPQDRADVILYLEKK